MFILNLIFHRYPSTPAHGPRYHVIDVRVHVYTYKLHVHECVTRLRRENKVLYVRKTPLYVRWRGKRNKVSTIYVLFCATVEKTQEQKR